jgi:hypothetical protein
MTRIVFLAGFFVACSMCVAAQNFQDRQMLAGLSGVNVFVLPPSPAVLKAFAVSRSDITTQVELHLRQAGLRIIEKNNTNAPPLLFISINSTAPASEDCPLYAVSIDLQLLQVGRLVHTVGGPEQKINYLGVWHAHRAYLYGTDAAQMHFRRNVIDVVDQFLNDYLAANPKR